MSPCAVYPNEATWHRAALAPNVRERAERMRGLRFASSMVAALANEFR